MKEIKVYENFEEIQEEIAALPHQVLYKYRTWENEYHRSIITKREIWFAEPHSLNDPYDMRPPYNFIVDNINWEMFRKKLYDAGRYWEPDLSEDELQEEVECRLKNAQIDPKAYFEANRKEYIDNPENYRNVGVFSCCVSGENEAMWAHYGNNHQGFAIGFDTLELSRALNCTASYVTYDDTPIDIEILGDKRKSFGNEIFQKASKWSSEEEFRFTTAGIGYYRNRNLIYPPEIAIEVLFGINTAQETIDEVVAACQNSIPHVAFYRLATKPDGYGFNKSNLF